MDRRGHPDQTRSRLSSILRRPFARGPPAPPPPPRAPPSPQPAGSDTASLTSSARRRIVTNQRINPNPLARPRHAAAHRSRAKYPDSAFIQTLKSPQPDSYAAVPLLNLDIWPAIPQTVVYLDDAPSNQLPLHDDWTTSLGIAVGGRASSRSPQTSSSLVLAPPPRKRTRSTNPSNQATSDRPQPLTKPKDDPSTSAVERMPSEKRKRQRYNLNTYTALARQEIEYARAAETLSAATGKLTRHSTTPSSNSHSSAGAGTHSSASTRGRLKPYSPPSSPIPSAPPGSSKERGRRRRDHVEEVRYAGDDTVESIDTTAFGDRKCKTTLQIRYSSALRGESLAQSAHRLESDGRSPSPLTSPSLYRSRSSSSLGASAFGRPSIGSSGGYAGGAESVGTRSSEPHTLMQQISAPGLQGQPIEENEGGDDHEVSRSSVRRQHAPAPLNLTPERRPWEYLVAEQLLYAASSRSIMSSSQFTSSSHYEEISTDSSRSRSLRIFSPARSTHSFARSVGDSLGSRFSRRHRSSSTGTPSRGAPSDDRGSDTLQVPQVSNKSRLLDRLPLSASTALGDFHNPPSPRRHLLGAGDSDTSLPASPKTPRSPSSAGVPALIEAGDDPSSGSEFSWYDAQDDLVNGGTKMTDPTFDRTHMFAVKRSKSAAWIFDSTLSRGGATSDRTHWMTNPRVFSSSPDIAPVSTIEMRALQTWPEGNEAEGEVEEDQLGEVSITRSSRMSREFQISIPLPKGRLKSRSMFNGAGDANFLTKSPKQLDKAWKRHQQRLSEHLVRVSNESTPVVHRHREFGHAHSLSSPATLPQGGVSDILALVSSDATLANHQSPEMVERRLHVPTNHPQNRIASSRTCVNDDDHVNHSLSSRPLYPEFWRSMWSLSGNASSTNRSTLDEEDEDEGRRARRRGVSKVEGVQSGCSSLGLIPPNAWFFVFGFLFFPLWYVGCCYPSVGVIGSGGGGTNRSGLVRSNSRRNRSIDQSIDGESIEQVDETRWMTTGGRGGPLSGWPARSGSLSSCSTHIPDFENGSNQMRALGGFWTEVAPRVDVEASQLEDAPMWAYQRSIHTWRMRCRVVAVVFPFVAVPLIVVVFVLFRSH